MTGVKGYIRENLPPLWEKALLEHKCIGSFVNQFYQAIAKEKNKNKYHYKVTIINAKYYLRTHSLGAIAIGFKFKEGSDFWTEVNNKVIYYNEMYK